MFDGIRHFRGGVGSGPRFYFAVFDDAFVVLRPSRWSWLRALGVGMLSNNSLAGSDSIEKSMRREKRDFVSLGPDATSLDVVSGLQHALRLPVSDVLQARRTFPPKWPFAFGTLGMSLLTPSLRKTGFSLRLVMRDGEKHRFGFWGDQWPTIMGLIAPLLGDRLVVDND